MLMFLSIMIAGLAVVAVFAAIVSGAGPTEQPRTDTRISVEPSRFFAGDIAPVSGPGPVPQEMLLSQIERHVRLEQAAAERFVNVPTPETLHIPTASPFLN